MPARRLSSLPGHRIARTMARALERKPAGTGRVDHSRNCVRVLLVGSCHGPRRTDVSGSPVDLSTQAVFDNAYHFRYTAVVTARVKHLQVGFDPGCSASLLRSTLGQVPHAHRPASVRNM